MLSESTHSEARTRCVCLTWSLRGDAVELAMALKVGRQRASRRSSSSSDAITRTPSTPLLSSVDGSRRCAMVGAARWSRRCAMQCALGHFLLDARKHERGAVAMSPGLSTSALRRHDSTASPALGIGRSAPTRCGTHSHDGSRRLAAPVTAARSGLPRSGEPKGVTDRYRREPARRCPNRVATTPYRALTRGIDACRWSLAHGGGVAPRIG